VRDETPPLVKPRPRYRWRCTACPATERNVSGEPEMLRLPRGWRAEPLLCSTCAAAFYRERGSAIRPGGGPRPLVVPSQRELHEARGESEVRLPKRERGPSAVERAEAELLAGDPGRLDREVAAAAGVSRQTVGVARKRLEAAGAIPSVERRGGDHRRRAAA
jgi:hypothetical protein